MIISHRRADLLDQFKPDPFEHHIEIWKEFDNHDEEIWTVKEISGSPNTRRDIVEVLLQCGFRDYNTVGQFKFIVEPGTYMDATYNKLLDELPKHNFSIVDSSLGADCLYIVYKSQVNREQ